MNRTISSRRHIAFNINIYYSLRFGFGLPFVAARSSRLVVFVSGSGCAVQSLLIIVYKELVLVFCLLSCLCLGWPLPLSLLFCSVSSWSSVSRVPLRSGPVLVQLSLPEPEPEPSLVWSSLSISLSLVASCSLPALLCSPLSCFLLCSSLLLNVNRTFSQNPSAASPLAY